MKNLKNYNVIELNHEDTLKVQGGSLSDFGEWLTDTLAAGVCNLISFRDWLNEQAGPNAGTPSDGNYMSLPG